jgi:hypothetical protein
MKNNEFRKAQTKASRQVLKIDKFIDAVKDEHGEYTFASLLFKRLLNKITEEDLDMMLFELQQKFSYQALKISSLVEEMRFEAFKTELNTNPYQFN